MWQSVCGTRGIIGEALNAARRELPELAALIPDLPKIVGFRSMWAHQYDDIRDDAMERIVEVDLPPLMARLTELLEHAKPPDEP